MKANLINSLESGDMNQILTQITEMKADPDLFLNNIENDYQEIPEGLRDIFGQALSVYDLNSTDLSKMLIAAKLTIQAKDAKIILISMNPAVDIYPDGRMDPGGTAGTIGSILSSFGIPYIMCGFVSRGVTGEIFKALARKKGIDLNHMTEVAGNTGFNYFVTPTLKLPRVGPIITGPERNVFLNNFKKIIKDTDANCPPLIIFSGTIPPFVATDNSSMYFQMIQSVRDIQSNQRRKSKIWVDAKGKVLLESIKSRPDYVKINEIEFSDLLIDLNIITKGQTLNELQMATMAKDFIHKNEIEGMTITLGHKGAIQVTREGRDAYLVKTNKHGQNKICIAGLGDTLLAIQAIGYVRESQRLSSLDYGVAAALASAEKPGTELIGNLSEIDDRIDRLERKALRLANIMPAYELHDALNHMEKKHCYPIVVADMDDTLGPFGREISPKMAEVILRITEKTKFAILTSASINSAVNQAISQINGYRQNNPNVGKLSNLFVFPTQGSQGWEIDSSGLPKSLFIRKITDFIDAGSVDIIKRMIDTAAKKFNLLPTNGSHIDDRGSQITFYTLGQNATPEEKDRYDKSHGREQRKEIAKFLNKEFERLGIEVWAQPGGKSSIDITPAGMNKAFGIDRIMQYCQTERSPIIFLGDELWRGGIDVPAAQRADITINVGPTPKEIPASSFFINSKKYGPEGALESLQMILKHLCP